MSDSFLPEIDFSDVNFASSVLNAVSRDQTIITNNIQQLQPQSSNPIPTYPSPRRSAVVRERLSESASDVYARILLTKRTGYPLWILEPTSYPREYAAEGVNIGDVGEITYDGSFNFLFNVCLPRDHPINCLAPPDLEPIQFDRNRDVTTLPNLHPRGFVIASQSVCETIEPGFESQNRRSSSVDRGRFHFSCTLRDGALLVLPDSATRFDHRFRKTFMEYAQRHVQSWYQHVNGTLGSMAHNGSLYLVTGADKSSNWCLASYSNRSGQTAIPLRFFADAATIPASRRLWQSSGLVDSRTCSIIEDIPQNQCVFLRGYKLAISENLFERKFVGPVKVTDIVTMKPADVLAKGKSIPGLSKSFSLIPKFLKGGTVSQSSKVASDNDVIVEEFPPLAESYHPSTNVILHLLRTNPDAEVAMIHDDVWCSVITEDDTVVPDDTEMLRRILEKYRPVQEEGCLSLALKDELDFKETNTSPGSPQGKTIQKQKETLVSTQDKGLELNVVPKPPKETIKNPDATDELDPISEQDLIIVVIIGPTGSGKTSVGVSLCICESQANALGQFINVATGTSDGVVGHGLKACTTDIDSFSCPHPDGSGRRVVFLDTPGFDDTNTTIADVLTSVENWLTATYGHKTTLTRLLLLHRISDARMTKHPFDNLNIPLPQHVVDLLQNVIITTTMWNQVDEHTGLAREAELRLQGPLTLPIPRLARFDYTHESAWAIINQLVARRDPWQLTLEPAEEEWPFVPTAGSSPSVRDFGRLVSNTRAKIRRTKLKVRLMIANAEAERAANR